MFDRAGLGIVAHTEVRISDLHTSEISPKLNVCDGDTFLLVEGYAIRAKAETAEGNMNRNDLPSHDDQAA